MIKIEDLFTTEATAEYLGCSVLNVKRHLIGISIHPRLRLYHREELDHYKAQMTNARKHGRTPYPDIEILAAQVNAELMTFAEACQKLGVGLAQGHKLLHEKLIRFPPTRGVMLRRSDVEALINTRSS